MTGRNSLCLVGAERCSCLDGEHVPRGFAEASLMAQCRRESVSADAKASHKCSPLPPCLPLLSRAQGVDSLQTPLKEAGASSCERPAACPGGEEEAVCL